MCVTSTFSLWLERNKRTYVLIARIPSPGTGRKKKYKKAQPLLQLLGSLPSCLAWPVTSGLGMSEF